MWIRPKKWLLLNGQMVGKYIEKSSEQFENPKARNGRLAAGCGKCKKMPVALVDAPWPPHDNYNYTNYTNYSHSYNYNYHVTTTTTSTTATTTTTPHYNTTATVTTTTTTLQLQQHQLQLQLQLHHTTPHYIQQLWWGDHCKHSKKHNSNHLSIERFALPFMHHTNSLLP